jgi:hypothetical protein
MTNPSIERTLTQRNNQIIGNVGLFYVCYRLSQLGWNALPTSRNARGVDIIVYNQDASRTMTIQVKSLSHRNPVPLGNRLDHLFADFVIICRNALENSPECFVLKPGEVKKLAHRGEKDGKVSYWLQPREYEQEQFRENWHRIDQG